MPASTSPNTAAWLDAPYADLTVRESPVPVAGPTQLLVRARAVAVNPLDAVIQSNGRMMYRWLDSPAVLGEDVAGEVVAVGATVTRFAKGDRVVGYALGVEKGRDHVGEGAFQHHLLLEEALTAPVPDGKAFEDVVALPLAVSTAAVALFQSDHLALAHPQIGSDRVAERSGIAPARGETVVVWGGATSVGLNAVQLAVAAGYRVVTTASPANHALLLELGAAVAIDYRDPDVVAKVVEAVGGQPVAGVIAIATGSAEPCVAIAAATGARRVALTSPSVSFYDQPRRAGLSRRRVGMIARLVAGNVALQLRCLRHGVRARFVWGSTLVDNEVGRMLWTDHLPAALAEGRHRVLPRAEVVGTGLPSIQPALDRLRGGVSATKLVVLLP
ncbi:zinc-binding alcohol dehydrogenase family protein [Herbiconiux sp. VKM Ac-1786]|uniref:zinc-binding alcohol dehydrogenase family protein n=1 Tax=Herbiconiux sp. VKM Ac-1786 TaxID=2783824 RepID=UPI00188AE897|nr:zinc-binding alcohol dehydrogenase family protein [Herbiconiux sp. VKM Ac-1786]MBF4573406.1 zinc-binding alcohol dehydrogenase family protein [Herbiconiux sp. VKM Ac-1786]